MKLIIITDTHFVAPGNILYGLNPRNRLEAVISIINHHHLDASLCIFLGDLTNACTKEAFLNFKECVDKLQIPLQLLIGNHDNRDIFIKTFPEQGLDSNGFVQSVKKTSKGLLVFLDTQDAETSVGNYCKIRQQWLKNQLEKNSKSPVFLFMHHPPFNINVPTLDKTKIKQALIFESIIRPHKARIRHLFFGHVHRFISGNWLGIPFSSCRGTNHQKTQEFLLNSKEPINHGSPFFGIVNIDNKCVNVQFLDTNVIFE